MLLRLFAWIFGWPLVLVRFGGPRHREFLYRLRQRDNGELFIRDEIAEEYTLLSNGEVAWTDKLVQYTMLAGRWRLHPSTVKGSRRCA